MLEKSLTPRSLPLSVPTQPRPPTLLPNQDIPAALYGSEASAVSVPACPLPAISGKTSGGAEGVGRSLRRVLNLCGDGEVVRVGRPSPLDDAGDFLGIGTAEGYGIVAGEEAGLLLQCGVQVRTGNHNLCTISLTHASIYI